MIDYYKLEGRRIFTQSKLEKIRRWYIRREHKIIFYAFLILISKELIQWSYILLRNYFSN